jgi:hypothetical protein
MVCWCHPMLDTGQLGRLHSAYTAGGDYAFLELEPSSLLVVVEEEEEEVRTRDDLPNTVEFKVC